MNPTRANQRHNIKITDLFEGYDEAGSMPGEQKGGLIGNALGRFSKFLESWFGIQDGHTYFFLALLGVFTAALCFFADLSSVYLMDSKPLVSNQQYRAALCADQP